MYLYFSLEVEQRNKGELMPVVACCLTRSAFCSTPFQAEQSGTGPASTLPTLPLDVASEWFIPALAGGVFHAHRRLRQLPTTR